MTPTNTPLPDLSGLKPCPFCGCDAWIIEDRGDHGTEPLLYRVQCKMCGASRGGCTYRDNAVLAWNLRAPDEALIAKVEALEGKEEGSARAESMWNGTLPVPSEPPLSAGAWRPWKAPDRYDIWPCEKDDIVDLRFSGPVMEATEHFAQRADDWDWTTNGEPLVIAWRPHNLAESSPSGAQRSELAISAPDDPESNSGADQ